MKLSDLVVDPGTNQLSHTKLWNNIVNAVITYVVIDLHLQGKLGLEWVLVYAAVVGTVGVASKLVSLRWGVPAQEAAKLAQPAPPGAPQ